jgi:hypothetical protein
MEKGVLSLPHFVPPKAKWGREEAFKGRFFNLPRNFSLAVSVNFPDCARSRDTPPPASPLEGEQAQQEVIGDFFRHKVPEEIPKIHFLPLPASGRRLKGVGGWVRRQIVRIFGLVQFLLMAIFCRRDSLD